MPMTDDADTNTAWNDFEVKKEHYRKCVSSFTPVPPSANLQYFPQIKAENIVDESFDPSAFSSHGGIVACSSFAALVCILCGFLVVSANNKQVDYSQGISYAINGNYSEAYGMFEQLQNYKDAKIWMIFCDYAEKYSSNDSYVGGADELSNLSFVYDTQYQEFIDRLSTSVENLETIKQEEDYARLLKEHPEYAVPKSDIHIGIPYKTHYRSGVVEYGVTIENKTDYSIVITSITISPSIPDYEKTIKVSVKIEVGAYESLSTSIDIGSGRKENGGSMTMRGTVYGDSAYYCSCFDFKLNE